MLTATSRDKHEFHKIFRKERRVPIAHGLETEKRAPLAGDDALVGKAQQHSRERDVNRANQYRDAVRLLWDRMTYGDPTCEALLESSPLLLDILFRLCRDRRSTAMTQQLTINKKNRFDNCIVLRDGIALCTPTGQELFRLRSLLRNKRCQQQALDVSSGSSRHFSVSV
jgi:hypothetical protein